jgi:hypothetical protein
MVEPERSLRVRAACFYAGFLADCMRRNDLLHGVGLHLLQELRFLDLAREHFRLVERVGAADDDLASGRPIPCRTYRHATSPASSAGTRARGRRADSDSTVPCPPSITLGRSERDLRTQAAESTTCALPPFQRSLQCPAANGHAGRRLM